MLEDCQHCYGEGICAKLSKAKDRRFPKKPYYCGVDDPKDCVFYKKRETES